MVQCRFWAQGNCKYGGSCKFEHSGPGPGQNRNRFGALNNAPQNNNAFGASRDTYRPNYNQTQNLGKTDDHGYSVRPDVIETDLGKERPIWPLSCYGPGRDAPRQLFGGFPIEQSPEEMRLYTYEAAANGQPNAGTQREQELAQQINGQIEQCLKDPIAAAKYVVDGRDVHPNRIDESITMGGQSASNQRPGGSLAFGQSSTTNQTPAFGQPSNAGQSSAFGKPSGLNTTPAFGQQLSQPAFGQPTPAGNASAFGQPSAMGGGAAFGQPSNPGSTSTFGQPSKPAFGQATAFGQPSQPGTTSAFGQPPQPSTTSAFGQPSQSGTTSAFGQPSQPGSKSAFGQPSQPGSTSAFGQPSQPGTSSAFGQPTQAARPSAFSQAVHPSPFGGPAASGVTPAFGQPAAAPAFGQPSQAGSTSAFGQASNSGPVPAFGQPAFGAPSQPGAFAEQPQASNTGSAFGKPAFGAPSAFSVAGAGPQPNTAFGQQQPPSASPFSAQPSKVSPFGVPSSGAQTSAFGQPAGAFGQPASPATGKPQANSLSTSAFTSTTGSSTVTGTSTFPPSVADVRGVDGQGNLTSFNGRPVRYEAWPPAEAGATGGKTHPFYQPNGRDWERIWQEKIPGPITAAEPRITPQIDLAALTDAYKYAVETGTFKDGIMPEIAPKREWVSFNV